MKCKLSILIFAILFLFPVVALAENENIDPDSDGSQYAWGENVGWINFEPSLGPGVTVTNTGLSGYAWGENIGWINLSPASGGVINDGAGNISGYAWGENVGWINFNGVKINPTTGVFSGYAWGENIGWINFAPNGKPIKTSWRPPTCTYSLSAQSQAFAASGGTGSVNVAAQPGCSWIATSNDAWITITSGSSGSGNGSVGYSVSQNTGTSARAGTMTIAGQTFTVNQAGVSCSYSLSSTSGAFAASGGTGSVNVAAQPGCSWIATSNDAWITITSGSSGSGNGSVGYSVSQNTGTSARAGTMTMAGQTFTVNQSASVVTVISPNGGEVIPSGSIYVIKWTAPSDAVKFDLLYSLNNGTTWKAIASKVTGSSYNWSVPKPTANKTKCLVKVIGYDADGAKVGEDTSDGTFTIAVVNIISPNGGEVLGSGKTWTIKFQVNSTTSPPVKANLYYTVNGGATWELITSRPCGPGGCYPEYPWSVPYVGTEKTKCKVRVVLLDAGGKVVGKDTSDGFFTIKPYVPEPPVEP